jgi:DNA-binding PucR family transcriptional regulator
MSNHHLTALGDALSTLRAAVDLDASMASLESSADATTTTLLKTVGAEVPAFGESRNPDIAPELAGHCARHTAELMRLITIGVDSDFDFVRQHVQQRAAQRFPLESILHAYRVGHKVYSRWLRQNFRAKAHDGGRAEVVAAAVAEFALAYTDATSTIAAEVYVDRTRLMAQVAGDQRAELLSILLGGYDESDRRVSQVLRDAGYLGHRQQYCVAIARSVDALEMRQPERARRLANAVGAALQDSGLRHLVDVRDNKVIAVCAATYRVSGWTRPLVPLSEHVVQGLSLLGNAVLVGVSADVQATSEIPRAFNQALTALEMASLSRRVVSIVNTALYDLMVQTSSDQLRELTPAWTRDFYRADDRSRGALSKTLRAYAATNMNVLKASAKLHLHPNSVYARLNKIERLSALDPKSFRDLRELLIVCDLRAD